MNSLPSFYDPLRAERKGHLLFVDDEEMILQGLRRTLRAHRGEWEAEFCTSPAAALEALDRKPFDAVISDMRMPGMNGAQFLAEVARRHPQVARIVFSGHSDRELVVSCVDVAHQYLSKPCEPADLLALIRRTLSLREAFQDDGVRRLVSRVEALPTKPDLYLEIVCKLQEPDAEVGGIAGVIERDMAMAAKVLKLVNSAFFGHPRRMSNIAEAVACLGLDAIRTLVLAIDVLDQFRHAGHTSRWLGDMWEHGYHVACAAREIARREGQAQRVVDEAFTGGLLHDAGKLVFAQNFPDEYESCFREACRRGEIPCEVEERYFGASHALVGAYLFGLWGLPAAVVEAVAFHHEPRRGTARGFSALTAVHVADALVHRLDPGAAGDEELLDTGYLAAEGWTARLADWEGVV